MTDDMRWQRESLTNSQKLRMEKIEKKLISKQDQKFHGMVGIWLVMDEALLKVATKAKITWPRWTPTYPLGDHPRAINQNLFVFYPYSFDSDQFIDTVKKANEDGFRVRVDSIASRIPGGNVRVIFWKPQNKKGIKKHNS